MYHEHRLKSPQQNHGKSNSTMYKKNSISQPSGIYPGMQGWFKIHQLAKEETSNDHINR